MNIINKARVQRLIITMYNAIHVRVMGIIQIVVHVKIALRHVIIVENQAICSAYALNAKTMSNLTNGEIHGTQGDLGIFEEGRELAKCRKPGPQCS